MTIDDRALIELLASRGASTIEHPGGSLLDHVARTARVLERWGDRPELVLAGLAHACYGTDGFPTALLSLDERGTLAATIGEVAERIVYCYASADRADLYPRLGAVGPVEHRDRFTGQVTHLDDQLVGDFAELTFANELDLVWTNPTWAAAHGRELAQLLGRWQPLVSAAARRALAASFPSSSTESGSP